MGSRDDTATATASSSSAAAAAAAAAAAQGPAASSPFAGWPGNFQALYSPAPSASATAAQRAYYSNPVPSSYAWAGQAGDRNPLFLQHMMTPYGAPIPYPAMYAHSTMFAHPSMTAGSRHAATVQAEPRAVELKVNTEGFEKSKPEARFEDASNSESESKGSSSAREERINLLSKKNVSAASGDRENGQHVVATSTATESSYTGRAVLHNLHSDLNVEAEHWNAPEAGAKVLPSSTKFEPTLDATSLAGREEMMSGHHWAKDERDLRKEKRKQSNRESARRSRIKKQQECEELARRVDELDGENSILAYKRDQLNKECDELEAENASLEKELIDCYGPAILPLLRGGDGEIHQFD